MTEREQLEQGIAALEAQRAVLGDAVVDTAIAALREKLAALVGTTHAPPPPTVEQRKLVTVLFADVVGFTAMAETLDPEEVRDIINALWERLDAAIIAQGGTIDKHIGDAVMALFGAPTAHEDDPERAIRAALAMQAQLRTFVYQAGHPVRDTDGNPLLQMRIGIHTGPVLLGVVGTTAEYTAMGDAVNMANRLQQAAPAGTVLISPDVYRVVRGIFNLRPLEPITVKGKAEPISVYQVRGAKPRAFRVGTRGVEGIETRMIGREAELKYLQEALATAIHERLTRVVTVVGEAGIGKSRLLHEFNSWTALDPELIWLFRARAGYQTEKLPYYLIHDLFSFRFEILESDTLSEAREKLEQGFALLGVEGEEKAHFIGHLIGFDFSDSPCLRGILGDARQIHDRAFHYATQFFRAVTAQGPVLIFLEDIHWADESSLDFIEHLAQTCQDVPILIICLARPSLYERHPLWGKEQSYHRRLELPPLSEQDSLRLVAEILRQVTNVPSSLRNMIVQRAEGNPFYIEELVKMLIEDRVILKGEKQWQVRPERLSEVRVPATLTGVLQARLDGLPLTERETLQRASVVGRLFWDGAVAYIGHVPRTIIQGALQGLQGKELVFERKEPAFVGEHEYVFKHALLRDVTYESVLKRQRRTYHAQVAAWLVEQSGERVGEFAGLIGEHYEQAGESLLAATWYEQAGAQARDTYAPEAAIHYYQKALGAVPEGREYVARKVQLYQGLGDALLLQTRFEEGAQAYTAMLQGAEMTGNGEAQARAWNSLAEVRDRQGDHRVALEYAERTEQIARSAGAQVELVKALCRKGQAFFRLGNGEAALAVAEQALELSTALGARDEMALSLNLLGSVYDMLGRFQQANDYAGRALAIYRELGNRNRVASVLNNLGESARMRGDYEAAIPLYTEALAIAREVGDHDIELFLRSNLGGALAGRGDSSAAEVELRQFLASAEGSGWVGIAESYCFLAEACLGQGKVAEALAAAQRALDLMRGHEEPALSGPAWRALGLVTARLPEPVRVGETSCDARACFGESLRLFTEAGMEGERARTLRAWARHELERGDRQHGAAMWQEARVIFARLGMELEVARMADSVAKDTRE